LLLEKWNNFSSILFLVVPLAEVPVNNINLDIDGHIIAGTPDEIRKINRQTGDVMWTLGGGANEFTFVDGDVSHFGGHGTYRLKNGNFLMYNNAVGTTTSRWPLPLALLREAG
jgi:hypothetical protein